MSSEILLESGTNELEILEFTIANNHYGINVAKVKEILPYKTPTPVPNAHHSIEGIFMPRDEIISVVNLMDCLGMPESAQKDQDMYILSSFNKISVAFHVNQVVGIHRVSWKEIKKPDATINNVQTGLSTGIVKLDDNLIIILDFEKVVSNINPETGLKVSDIDRFKGRNSNELPILICEDSQLLSTLIQDCLKQAGYSNIIVTGNGQEAWDKLESYKEADLISSKVACVITDLEMPQMDGHRLTKLIKTDPKLQSIPVIIFSSLISEEMKRKGEGLGADAQLTKPEIGELVSCIDRLLGVDAK